MNGMVDAHKWVGQILLHRLCFGHVELWENNIATNHKAAWLSWYLIIATLYEVNLEHTRIIFIQNWIFFCFKYYFRLLCDILTSGIKSMFVFDSFNTVWFILCYLIHSIVFDSVNVFDSVISIWFGSVLIDSGQFYLI